MSNEIDTVQCPLLNRAIDFGYCQDIQYVTDRMIKPEVLEDNIPPEKYPICQRCPKRIDPTK